MDTMGERWKARQDATRAAVPGLAKARRFVVDTALLRPGSPATHLRLRRRCYTRPVMRLRSVFLCAILLFEICVASPSVQAQSADEARVLFDAGVGASGAERWTQARDYLRRSAALKPKAATLLNLAVTEVKLGMRSAALATLDAFNRIANPVEHADMIERAQALRVIALQLAPDSDRTEAVDLSVSAPLTDARKPEPDMVASAPVAAAATAPSPPTSSALPSRAAAARPSLFAPRAMIVGGVALSAATYPLTVWWLGRRDAIERCNERVPSCDNRELLQRQRTEAMSTTIVSGALALGLLAGGSIWLLRLKRSVVSPVATLSTADWTLGMVGSF